MGIKRNKIMKNLLFRIKIIWYEIFGWPKREENEITKMARTIEIGNHIIVEGESIGKIDPRTLILQLSHINDWIQEWEKNYNPNRKL